MPRQTSLYVPTPCHEDWNKMTDTEQGKFCASCCKQVVDFTLMSDQQILNYLSNQSGKLCGRFDSEQLQRPLVETKMAKKKSWWMALTMPLLFLSERSHAQKNIVGNKHMSIRTAPRKNILVGDVSTKITADTLVEPTIRQPEIMGKLIYQPANEITVTGKVVDENDEPVAFATIEEKGAHKSVAADEEGKFSIKIRADSSMAVLEVSCVSFQPIEKQVLLTYGDQEIIVCMSAHTALLADVQVTSRTSPFLEGRLGGISVCRKISTIKKIDTTVRKAAKISSFKIYPNPAPKSGIINLEITRAGYYEFQLINNKSRLLAVDEINVSAEKSTATVQLPPNAASGIYYVRLTDEHDKKEFTEKLIIQ